MNTTIEKIERLNLSLIGIGALIGWGTGWMHLPSFLLGGGIMQFNFWLLKKVVRAVLVPSTSARSGKLRAAVWLSGKGLLFLLLLSALFVRYPVEARSFTVGVSLLLVACVIVTLSGSKTGPREVSPGA